MLCYGVLASLERIVQGLSIKKKQHPKQIKAGWKLC